MIERAFSTLPALGLPDFTPLKKKPKKSQGSEQDQCECRNAFGEDQMIVGEMVRTMIMAMGSFSSKLYQLPNPHPFYDSVVTLAFAFVTLTPSCFAFATMSTLFLDETA